MSHPSIPDRPADPRFTNALVADLVNVLTAHGYQLPDGPAGDQALGATIGVALVLARRFEGQDGEQ